MDKFGRNYRLDVQVQDGSTITIRPPFTVEFDIIRNTLTSANMCQIRVYNLSLVTRNRIRKNATDYGEQRSIVFQAGYGEKLGVAFRGNVSQAWTVREGVNMITQIECYDGGYAFVNGFTNRQFAAGTEYKSVIRSIAADLPGIAIGAIGAFPGALTRASSYSGATNAILAGLTGGAGFVDNERFNALGTNEYAEGAAIEIDAASGLLGTPTLERTVVHFDMIFEPQLEVGRLANITSLTEKSFNGLYKITAVKHRGMISEAVCGSVITTGEFFYSEELKAVVNG